MTETKIIEKIAKEFNNYLSSSFKKPNYIIMSNNNLSKLKTEVIHQCNFECNNKGYYFEGMEICIRTTDNDEIVLL